MIPNTEGQLTNPFSMKDIKLTFFLNPLLIQRYHTQKIDVKITKIELNRPYNPLHPTCIQVLQICVRHNKIFIYALCALQGLIKPHKTVLAQNENRTYNAGKYQKMKLFGISKKSLILDVLVGSEYSSVIMFL